MTQPNVSLIIPTRNRHKRLAATLSAVSCQTYPSENIEVLVVDDDSSDQTAWVVEASTDRVVDYVRQSHGGACAARNIGAGRARGELLIFVDDDVELMPDAVASLVTAHRDWPHTVIVGHLISPEPANRFQRLGVIPEHEVLAGCVPVECTKCFTGLLSVGREEFFALGQFQDPTGGWPSWDDIDFGYRALEAGVTLISTSEARGIHHDQSAASLQATARRWRAASETAVRLFMRHPGLQQSFPFYRDKLPITWGRDPSSLVVRKLLRSLVSSRPCLEVVEQIADLFIRNDWPARLTRPLCGCVISGYMWRGLRDGITTNGGLSLSGAHEVD